MPKVQTIGNPLSGRRRKSGVPALVRIAIYLAIICSLIAVATFVIGTATDTGIASSQNNESGTTDKSPLIRGKNMKFDSSNGAVKSDGDDNEKGDDGEGDGDGDDGRGDDGRGDDGKGDDGKGDDGNGRDDGEGGGDGDGDGDGDGGYQELPQTLTLNTVEGEIVINLRPDLSRESVEYIKALLDSPEPCKKCRLYRAEPRGILQGILTKNGVKAGISKLGKCPDGAKVEPGEKCHGPMMTRGMVGWAAGEGGPDFFIDNYERKADWWGHEHTVWGEVNDENSLEVINGIFDLPAHKESLTFLDVPIHIDISE